MLYNNDIQINKLAACSLRLSVQHGNISFKQESYIYMFFLSYCKVEDFILLVMCSLQGLLSHVDIETCNKQKDEKYRGIQRTEKD